MTVNTSPTTITGITNVCTGLTTSLTDGVAGGTWTSDNLSIVTIGASSGVATGVAIGTATISYTLTGSCITTIVVTVSPTLSPVFGTLNVCAGSSTNLSNTVAGGTWSSSNSSIASIGTGTGVVTGVAAGTTIISYSTGSCSSVGAIVTVNPLPSAISGSLSVCEGFTTSLSDATTSGTWNSSNTTVATVNTTGLVSGLISGTTSVAYVLTTGCLTSVTVTVNPMPGPISGAAVVCAGSTTSLSDAITGGTWTSAAPAVASVVSTSGALTGNTAGSTTISYTLTGGCFQVLPVTVHTPPTAISGPTNICAGNTFVLTDGVPGGSWSSTVPAAASVNAATGVVAGLSPGFTFISYTIDGCAAVAHPMNVLPSPAPISGITHVCAGLSTVLTDATVGGTWSSSNPGVTVSPTGVVALTAGAGATITYALAAGCYTTADVVAESLPAPIMGADSVCPGASVVLSDATPGGVWSSSDGTIALSIALTGEVRGMAGGNVHITYTLVSGCYVTVPFLVSTPLPASLNVTSSSVDTFLCHNTTDTLFANPVNGGSPTFEWRLFGSYIGAGATFSYNPTHGDFLTCIMTTHGVCASPAVVSKDVVLNVWPQGGPIVDITTSQPDTSAYLGEVYTFYSTVTFGGPSPIYQWYINNAPVAGANAPVFTTHLYNENDTIYCKVTGNSPCDTGSYVGNSNRKVIYGQGYLSVNSLSPSANNSSLFPNPNAGTFTVYKALNTVSGDEASIEVTNMLGQAVYTERAVPQNGAISTRIDLGNNVPAGVYILKLSGAGGGESFRFTVDK